MRTVVKWVDVMVVRKVALSADKKVSERVEKTVVLTVSVTAELWDYSLDVLMAASLGYRTDERTAALKADQWAGSTEQRMDERKVVPWVGQTVVKTAERSVLLLVESLAGRTVVGLVGWRVDAMEM